MSVHPAWWLALAFALIYLTPLNVRPLFTPDELRYAQIPREMLLSGDWVVPRLNGLRYFEKPPFGYWANALSMSLFGETAFALRLPGAMAIGSTALVMFLFISKVFARRDIALLSAAIYLGFVGVYFIGTFNVLDNMLVLALTVSIAAVFLALDAPGAKYSSHLATIGGVAMGVAFLTKGFLAVVVPAIVLGPWLLWEWRFAGLPRVALFASLGLAPVAAPWAILIHLAEPDYWHYFVWEEHVRRFLASNAQHKQPFYYFLLLLPLIGFPWLTFVPAAIAGLRQHRVHGFQRGHRRFVLIWFLAPLLFFSYSNGKLVTYILPCMVPLAMLIAIGLDAARRADNRLWTDIALWFNAAVLGIAGLTVGALQQLGADSGLAIFTDPVTAGVVAMACFLGAVLSMRAARAQRWQRKLTLACLVGLPLLAVTQFCMPAQLLYKKNPGALLKPIAEWLSPSAIVVSDSGSIRAVSWYLQRVDVLLLGEGELKYGLSYADASERLLKEADLRHLLGDGRAGRPVAIICKRKCPYDVGRLSPLPLESRRTGDFVMWYLPRNSPASSIR